MLPFCISGKPYSLLQEFQQARLRKDYQEALKLCYEAVKNQPTLVPKLIDQPDFFRIDSVITSQTEIDAKGAEGLLSIQRFLADHHRSEAMFWHKHRSLSAIHFQKIIPNYLRPVLKTALTKYAGDLPFLVVEQYAENLLAEQPNDENAWKKLIPEATFLENILLHLDILYPQNTLLGAQIGERLFFWMANLCPDCEEIENIYDTRLINNLIEPEEYQLIFSALRFQLCPYSAFRDTVLRRVNVFAPTSYYYRLAAGEYIKKESLLQAQRLLEASIEIDTTNSFKAMDLLQLAQIYQLRQNFRTSRLYAEKADELLPEWGRPWLFMADLIHQSAPFCNFSPLERKSLNWLATDYCEKAMNLNPALSREAIERITRFRKEFPSRQELLFFGFQLGDSFPIPCWIGTATRVRY